MNLQMAKHKRVYPGDRFISPPDLVKRLDGSKPRYPLSVSYRGNGSARYYSWLTPWKPAKPDLDVSGAAPSEWTTDAVEAELRRAMVILKRLPNRGIAPAGFQSCMPQVVRDFFEAYGADEGAPRLIASIQDVGRMDRALGWLSWLETRNDCVIVTAAAIGVSWRRIGWVVRRSHEHCRMRHKRAVEIICARLDIATRI